VSSSNGSLNQQLSTSKGRLHRVNGRNRSFDIYNNYILRCMRFPPNADNCQRTSNRLPSGGARPEPAIKTILTTPRTSEENRKFCGDSLSSSHIMWEFEGTSPRRPFLSNPHCPDWTHVLRLQTCLYIQLPFQTIIYHPLWSGWADRQINKLIDCRRQLWQIFSFYHSFSL